MTELNREFWLQWQDEVVEQARLNLQRDGHLMPMVFIVTTPERLSLKAREVLAQAVELRPGDKEKPFHMILVPIDYSWPTLLSYAAAYLVPQEKHGVLENGLGILCRSGASKEEAAKAMVRALCEKAGIHENSLVAMHIRHVLKESGALGFCKLDDAFVLQIPDAEGFDNLTPEERVKRASEFRNKYPEDLSDCPEASECIQCSLETISFQRLVQVPYTRTKRHDGQVTGFGKPQVIEANRFDETRHHSAGRFAWMMEEPV